jgi:3-oxoadipate enol-lactonase
MGAIEVRGIELAYERQGSGAPFIWGHGLSQNMAAEEGLGLMEWPAIRRLVEVIRYDARGHGESTSTSEPADYHWRELALDQLALADALGIATYVAGGASMGCATALHAAVLAPDRVEALVLVIPPTAWASRAAQGAGYEMMAQLIEAGKFDLILAGARMQPIPDPMVDSPTWHARFEATLRGTDPVRLARVFRGAAVADFPSAEAIATLRMPTTIMAWSGDPGHPVSTAERLVQLLPHATLTVAHTAQDLAGWTGIVTDFLRTL